MPMAGILAPPGSRRLGTRPGLTPSAAIGFPSGELLVKDHGDLAALAAGHEAVGLRGLFDAETVGDERVGMDAPAHDLFHQVLHAPEVGHPGAVDGLLVMDDVLAGLEGHGAALADEADLAPFSGGLDADEAG